jgi:hypothetical protein
LSDDRIITDLPNFEGDRVKIAYVALGIAVSGATERLMFLVAVRPGLQSPTLAPA